MSVQSVQSAELNEAKHTHTRAAWNSVKVAVNTELYTFGLVVDVKFDTKKPTLTVAGVGT